ncbi:DUF1731 domain-containing protein [Streptomyces sp. CL12]|uniref:DUF1731 domain-containing protein n=1 Tax=Streptomyces sp. CL12 TaxID=3391744 RepID=UPI003A80D35D
MWSRSHAVTGHFAARAPRSRVVPAGRPGERAQRQAETPATRKVALRSDTELLPRSRRVVPGRPVEAGFAFRYPQWPRAADELVHRARERGGASAGR